MMKYTVARLAFVATFAAIVGVFVALIVYVTLRAALIFLLLARENWTSTCVATLPLKRGRKSYTSA